MGTILVILFLIIQLEHLVRLMNQFKAGIVIINQELALFPELTVYENIFVGHEVAKNGFVNWEETKRQAKFYLELVGLDVGYL